MLHPDESQDRGVESDVDRSDIGALERGLYAGSVDMVDRLAVVLRVEPGALFQPQASPKRSSADTT